MSLTKIKLDEVDTKATPVLADSILISDSADGGRGKISTLTDLQTLIGGGGGGGAVDSVAGKTGDVTLDASDISETAALKIMTADERTKLTGIAEGAEVNTVDSVAGKTGDVTLDASDVAPTASKLWMSDTQASKLSGIAENANNYTHPATHPQSMIEGLADALAAKAPLASPALTGTPTAPTAASGTNTTQLATTEFVQDALADISIDADPYSVKLTGDQSIGGIKTFTSSPVLPTPTAGDDTTKAATTAFVSGAIAQKAPLESPALTGTPTAPTAPMWMNTTQLATTAFVQAATASAIYDLPVTRSGSVSAGTDVVLLETGVLDPAWYDETHVLNVSFFARNGSKINNNTTFKLQLYDEGTSTAHTIASITADTSDYRLLQASIYRFSSSSVNCNIQYGNASGYGFVYIAAGSYKLRVVCTSTIPIVFGSAQVRFTK